MSFLLSTRTMATSGTVLMVALIVASHFFPDSVPEVIRAEIDLVLDLLVNLITYLHQTIALYFDPSKLDVYCRYPIVDPDQPSPQARQVLRFVEDDWQNKFNTTRTQGEGNTGCINMVFESSNATRRTLCNPTEQAYNLTCAFRKNACFAFEVQIPYKAYKIFDRIICKCLQLPYATCSHLPEALKLG